MSATVSRKADRWFASITVQDDINEPVTPSGEPLGVDLGISSLATCSNGLKYENPRHYKKKLKKLRKLNKELSRKQKGSRNRDKAQTRLAKKYQRITNNFGSRLLGVFLDIN